jgi:hypothetical protein
MLHGCGQQYFQHMSNLRQKLMTQMAMVNDVSVAGDLEGKLQAGQRT